MSWEKRTNLKDIAGRVGVSIAAVSLALRNHPSISAATTERVKKVAKELNYTPDPGLSALAAHRSRLRVHRDFSVIAFVTNWSTRDAWTKRASARQAIEGATLRARSLEDKAAAARAVERHVVPLLAAGSVRVPVQSTFAMSDAAGAYEAFAAGGKLGKLVLLS